jgi:hypothetical protein
LRDHAKGRSRMGSFPMFLILLFLIGWKGPLCHRAFGLMGDSEKGLGLDGSVRTFPFLLDQDGTFPFSRQNEVDGLFQTILRLTAAGRPSDSFSYEVHWVQSATLSTRNLSAGTGVTFGNTADVLRYRVLNASWNVLNEERISAVSSFDRFNAKMAFDWGDVTAGRQAITIGETFFWNPLDVFFPFDANQFDRDYKPGVDALRVDIPLGLFSGVNLIGAAGPRVEMGAGVSSGNNPEDASWYGSAVLGRVFTHLTSWDFSLQAGKIFGGWQVGAGAVGDVGPMQVRWEAAQFWAMPSDPLPLPLKGDLVEDSFLGVFGLGHRFKNSLSLDFEYFYNGAGDPGNLAAALARSQFGSSLQLSRHLIGLVARYELTPLTTAQVSTIVSLCDGSTQVQPLFTISVSNDMDLLIGTVLNFGSPPDQTGSSLKIQSEFGTLPDVFFLEWKVYF